MEKSLVLHSEEGTKADWKKQSVTFALDPPIQLNAEGDFYLGVRQFSYETNGLFFTTAGSFEAYHPHGGRRRKFHVLMHHRFIADLIQDLNQQLKKVDRQNPPTIEMSEDGEHAVLTTKRRGISKMSQQLVKVLGLGQRDFPAENEFIGGMQPSLPAQLEFYVCMD